MTGGNGRFFFANVPQGSFVVLAERDGDVAKELIFDKLVFPW